MTVAPRRAFSRTLTGTLALVGLFTAGAVFLFGHLLFRALSKDVVDEALLTSRLDAERIARSVAEKSSQDLFTLKAKQTEIDSFVGTALRERRILNELRVFDRAGRLVYTYQSQLELPERAPPAGGAEGQGVGLSPSGLASPSRSQETVMPIADPYDIEVPIGDFGVFHFGVSKKELQGRVEALRSKLYKRTFAAAIVSLLGIGAASAAIGLLYQRTRRMEEAQMEAERRAALGEVAAGLAHEIRNPLNAMSLNLELLEESVQRGEGRARGADPAELARAARVETGRLSRLLTDFLAYAKPSPISAVAADLNAPAADAVAFLRPEAESRKIRLEFTPHAGPAAALLDEARVKQVVLNLVANALDAVESEGAAARDVFVKVEDAGAFWRLTVTDRGPGVAAARVSELFKVFVSTKPAGTGLGLPIAERIVKAHGGALTLVSKAGEPTAAVATFPKAS